MPLSSTTSGFAGKPVRFYVDAAELPWFYFSLAIVLVYLGSFWLAVSYLTVMAPLILVGQIVTAMVTAYLLGVRAGHRWVQVAVTCFIVGAATGLVSAVLAVVRFHYAWLIANVVVEPVWSGLIAAAAGLATHVFFHLPFTLKRFWAS